MSSLYDVTNLKNYATLKDKLQKIPTATERGRFHFTDKPLASAYNTPRGWLGVADYKPRGLWYGFKGSWTNYLLDMADYAQWAAERFDESNYLYRVTINRKRVLVINSHESAKRFTKIYGVELPSIGCKYNFLINWKKVARTFDGVEVNDCFDDEDGEFLWFKQWDCSSGCVWNKSGIKSVKLAASFPESGSNK